MGRVSGVSPLDASSRIQQTRVSWRTERQASSAASRRRVTSDVVTGSGGIRILPSGALHVKGDAMGTRGMGTRGDAITAGADSRRAGEGWGGELRFTRKKT